MTKCSSVTAQRHWALRKVLLVLVSGTHHILNKRYSSVQTALREWINSIKWIELEVLNLGSQVHVCMNWHTDFLCGFLLFKTRSWTPLWTFLWISVNRTVISVFFSFFFWELNNVCMYVHHTNSCTCSRDLLLISVTYLEDMYTDFVTEGKIVIQVFHIAGN